MKTKQKRIKYGAPSKALSAYNIFYKEKATGLKRNENLQFKDFAVKLSEEYRNLDDTERARYKDLANKEKERYESAMEIFKKTEHYNQYMKSLKSTPDKQDSNPIKTVAKPVQKTEQKESNKNHVNIFTKEFLEHSQLREEKLRHLRKQAAQLDEQTALLSKHLDNLNSGIQAAECGVCRHQLQSEAADKVKAALETLLLGALPSRSCQQSEVVQFVTEAVRSDKDAVRKIRERLRTLPFTNELKRLE